MELRLGIIGVGGMGGNHASSIISGKTRRIRLTAVCDIDPTKLERFPDQAHFTDSRELIRSGLVDAVLIATPHYDHTTIGIDALGAGLHVLVEKPLSVHVADCQKLIAAYEQRPRQEQVFAAMFNERTIPRNRKLRELIHSGQLGAINRIAWTTTDWFRSEAYYRSGGWRATWKGEGGGILTNQCPHRLDLLQWWFGQPAQIHAFVRYGRYHDIEVEDDVTAHLTWANGATGVFIATTGECPGVNRLEIAAERGLVVVDGEGIRWWRNEVETTEYSRTTSKTMARPPTWKIDIPSDGIAGMHPEVISNFADAILDGTPLIAPATEGIRAVEIANSIILSGATRSTVELPLDPAAYLRLHQQLVAGSRTKATNLQPATTTSAAELSASFGR